MLFLAPDPCLLLALLLRLLPSIVLPWTDHLPFLLAAAGSTRFPDFVVRMPPLAAVETFLVYELVWALLPRPCCAGLGTRGVLSGMAPAL